jgi:hypothetical protein
MRLVVQEFWHLCPEICLISQIPCLDSIHFIVLDVLQLLDTNPVQFPVTILT